MKNFVMAIAAVTAFTGGSLSATCQQQTTSVSEGLTLDQAINIALQNNRSAKNAKLEVEKASDRVVTLRTRRLPSLKLNTLVSQPLSTFDTNFEKGVFGTYPGIGPVPAENTVVRSSTNTTSSTANSTASPGNT